MWCSKGRIPVSGACPRLGLQATRRTVVAHKFVLTVVAHVVVVFVLIVGERVVAPRLVAHGPFVDFLILGM